MRAQEIIDKITDETKIDEILVDLAELSETENDYETRISELETDVDNRDKTIRELKVTNHELLKKVAESVDFHKDDEPEGELEVIKTEEEIFKGFAEREER